MDRKRPAPSEAIAVVDRPVAFAAPLRAQGIEFMPFGGYRFGGTFRARPTAPGGHRRFARAGLRVDVPLSDGLQSKR